MKQNNIRKQYNRTSKGLNEVARVLSEFETSLINLNEGLVPVLEAKLLYNKPNANDRNYSDLDPITKELIEAGSQFWEDILDHLEVLLSLEYIELLSFYYDLAVKSKKTRTLATLLLKHGQQRSLALLAPFPESMSERILDCNAWDMVTTGRRDNPIKFEYALMSRTLNLLLTIPHYVVGTDLRFKFLQSLIRLQQALARYIPVEIQSEAAQSNPIGQPKIQKTRPPLRVITEAKK